MRYRIEPQKCPFCGEGAIIVRMVRGQRKTMHLELGVATARYECGGFLSIRPDSFGWTAVDGGCGRLLLGYLDRDKDERLAKAVADYKARVVLSRRAAGRLANPSGLPNEPEELEEPVADEEASRSPRLRDEIALRFGVTDWELREAIERS